MQPSKALGLAFFISAGVPIPAPAQTLPQGALTLEHAESLAVRQNPDVALARLRADSASGERRISRAFPNPLLSAAPGSPYQYNASLPLDLGPQRLYRTRAGAQGSLAASIDIADLTRQVLLAVRRAFYDVLLAGDLEALAREQRDVFRQLLAADSVRVRAGDAPERNLVRSELELSRAEASVTQAVVTTRAARLFLQQLLGLPKADPELSVAGAIAYRPVTVAADSLLAVARANRPDLKAAEVRTDQARSLSSFATSQLVPIPQVTLAWQPPLSGPFVPPTFWSIGGPASHFALGLGLVLPLFNWNGGARQRATAGLASASVNAERIRRQVAAELLVALDQFQAAREIVGRYESGLVERARTALDQSRYAYQAGATSLLDLLDAIRTHGETVGDYRRALHDYWVAGWTLNAVVGKDVIR